MVFYSHKDPPKLLRDHIAEVSKIACNKAMFQDEIRIASLFHDFGKFTSYFQTYLDTENKTSLSRHGFISALAAAFITSITIGEYVSGLTVYSAVLHHHGDLNNIEHNLPKRRDRINPVHDAYLLYKINDAKLQIDDMRQNLDIICSEYAQFGYADEVKQFIAKGSLEEILLNLKKAQLRGGHDYLKHQYIYSRLIYADKMSASNTEIPAEKFLTYSKLNNERKKICTQKSKLNDIRSEIFSSVQQNLHENWNNYDIFSITAPTGTGKTYSGFFAALKLKELANMSGKIIYALPYTSIINQNYKNLKQLFLNAGAFDDSYILMHHHLGDVKYKTVNNKGLYEDEKEDYKLMQSQLLLESWSSGVIVTTFVQLLETLIGTRNKMLKKFHSFENSVILIDEIQSIDIKYHKIIEELLISATKKLNLKIILMTATKPLIFPGAFELVDNYEYYYSLFNRTKLLINLNPITCNEFISSFVDSYDERKSYLIVCNTIKQSLEIFNGLKKVKSLNENMLFYLSTNIIPKHRSEVINKIDSILKTPNKKEKPILVATQVVEAGVDLDFDEVYRDIAPFDSIIQCAGRCNRNNRESCDNKCGNVHIVKMKQQDSASSYASMIYKPNWLNITEKLFENKEIIEERDYLTVINAYFELIKKNTSNIEYEKYKKAIDDLDFDIISEFSLIEDKSGYIDAFIVIDEEAEEVFDQYNKTMAIKDIKTRMERLLEIRNKVLQYTISVPIRFSTKFESTPYMFFLPKEACCDNGEYSIKTGFNRVDDYDQFF